MRLKLTNNAILYHKWLLRLMGINYQRNSNTKFINYCKTRIMKIKSKKSNDRQKNGQLNFHEIEYIQ
jgi:hypothetical protein